MCDPITAITMGIGAMSSVMGMAGQNAELDAQVEQTDHQLAREYVEAQYNTREQKAQALEEAYVAEIERRKAVGEAKVRNAALGIRGSTANAIVSEQSRIGSYNVTNAMEMVNNADTAYTIGTSLTRASAIEQIDSLESQKATPFEMLLGGIGGAIGGMSQGQQINNSLNDPAGVLIGK